MGEGGYLRNHLTYRNSSPIKMCRVLPVKTWKSFQHKCWTTGIQSVNLILWSKGQLSILSAFLRHLQLKRSSQFYFFKYLNMFHSSNCPENILAAFLIKFCKWTIFVGPVVPEIDSDRLLVVFCPKKGVKGHWNLEVGHRKDASTYLWLTHWLALLACIMSQANLAL